MKYYLCNYINQVNITSDNSTSCSDKLNCQKKNVLTCQLIVLIRLYNKIPSRNSHGDYFRTIWHKDLTGGHKDLARRHKDLTKRSVNEWQKYATIK